MTLHNKKVLALIPARGGSKGIIGKNMRMIQGIPLIDYTLRSALNSKHITDVYLSSDDEKILSYGKKLGAISVFRPEKFSNDKASSSDVVNHFISIISKKLILNDPYIIYLQPTSPLRTKDHIDDALVKMKERGLHKLISVVEMSKNPFKAFVLNKNGFLKTLFKDGTTNMRRQDLPKVYMPNGAMHVFRVSDFSIKSAFPSNGSYPYIMSEEDSIDVDSENDLNLLNQIISSKKNSF